MKVKITEVTPDTIKLASCFVGSKLVGFDEDRLLIGVDGRYQYPFYVTDLHQYEQITLDLSTAQPCIYQCMKHGLKVEVEFIHQNGNWSKEYDLSIGEKQVELMMDCIEEYPDLLKSIKILDLDEMEGVEIEGMERRNGIMYTKSQIEATIPHNIRKLLQQGYKKARAQSTYPNIEMTEHYEKYHRPDHFIFKLTNKEFKLSISHVINTKYDDNIITNISHSMATDLLREIIQAR